MVFVGLVKNFIDITSKPESGLNFCPVFLIEAIK